MIGKRFGRLLVIKLVGKNKHRKLLWKCVCDCGEVLVVVGSSLRSGNTSSCGCFHLDVISSHKESKNTREYQAWRGMFDRCENLNNPDYPSYGGRGITVCSRWKSYENFLQDMGRKPTLQHSIERKDDYRTSFHKTNSKVI